jgi:inosose dehydratase
MNMGQKRTRRQFLQRVGVGAVASFAGSRIIFGQKVYAKEQDDSELIEKESFELGLASYTLREFGLEDTLIMTKRLGLKYIALKSMHLPLDSSAEQIRKVVEKIKRAGLKLYGGSVIYMNKESEVHRAFDYAKAAGMEIIVGVPKPELLSLVNEKVQQYDIKVAVHNHGPTDRVYPTPESAYERIKDLDERIGLCNDIGHTMRAGVDPSVSAERFAQRLLDVHMKDVTAANADGRAIEVGRGVIDIPRFLRTLKKIGYRGIVSFEYEKDAKDPLAGLAESVGYVRGVLAAI